MPTSTSAVLAPPVTLYTVREVASTLRVCRSTIVNYVREGKLRPVKFGHAVRFKREDVLAFIGEQP